MNTFREALDHDWLPFVFESSTDIGGLWRYKPYETEGKEIRLIGNIEPDRPHFFLPKFLPIYL